MTYLTLTSSSWEHQIRRGNNIPCMTLLYRFIKIKSSLWRKKFNRTNQGSNFLRDTFSNSNNLRSLIQFRSQPQHCKRIFSSRTSIAPVLLEWSNETSWVFNSIHRNLRCTIGTYWEFFNWQLPTCFFWMVRHLHSH